jgi:hypothetical protein
MSDPEKLRRWIIMLFSANYTERQFVLGSSIKTIKAGQCAYSLQRWADTFGCSKKSVMNFFDLLVIEKMITVETIGKGNRSTTLITIDNYACYQGNEETQTLPLTAPQTLPNGKRTGYTTKEREESKEGNKEKKDIRERKIFVPPTLSEMESFFEANGYSKQAAFEAFEWYEKLNWHNKDGKPVVVWQTTMRNNWFKEKNKNRQLPKL